MAADAPFVVHGLTVSYFTRKVTGYLDFAGLPWRLQPSIGANPAAREIGWNGGIPVVTDPAGEMIWDSTAIICHLDALGAGGPGRGVLPDDPTMRFLAYLLDDFSDEWFYRHAVGTRWLKDENRVSGSWDIAREGTREIDADIATVRAFVMGAMTDSLPKLGTSAENIDAWVQDSLVPWQRSLAAHLETGGGFLLGGRPSLADFAFFGGNAAHFVNDPWCRALMDSEAPGVVSASHRMMDPIVEVGPWASPDDLPGSLIALLAEAGRHYLPWVARATVDGEATVEFESGPTATIATTNFLTEARGVLLARYVDARSDQLDAILDQAGIVEHFADHVGQATSIPDPRPLPRPVDNRPYPAGR